MLSALLFYMLLSVAHHGLDMTIFIYLQRDDFQAAEPGRIVRGHAVVVEEIPLAFILHDAVMGGPAYDRL